ncbi:MAG: Holliday junction resolvase RuvX [Lachnospiraceae bacterium]
MRILALDYGAKTVGCAITDPLGITAQNLETIVRPEENKLRRTLARIEAITSEYGVERIVLGCPYNMDGTAGERVERVMAFKAMIERRTGLPVELVDERLTTVEADEVLELSHVPVKDRKKVIDQIAASVILRDYLNSHPVSAESGKTEN